MKIQCQRRERSPRGRTSALVALCMFGLAAPGCASVDDAVSGDAEALRGTSAAQNALSFHMIDFVGWNNRDWDVMRHYHSRDVLAVMGGQQTEGIDAHITALQAAIEANPDSRIVQHSPIVLQGSWTCMVGIAANGSKMATVAKWRDGTLSEEYVLFGQVQGALPQFADEPHVKIENKNEALRGATGAESDWSCAFGEAADGSNLAVFSKRGAPGATLAFTDLPSQ